MTPGKRVVVIGGGVTGLATAYRLTRTARTQGIALDVAVLEASAHLGGVIATQHYGDVLLEQGPDCFITAKPWGIRLCEELEIDDEVIGTTTEHRQSFIVRNGRLIAVPQGFYLMAPGAITPFLTTPVFSWRGKARMALDLMIPRRHSTEDESLADFVTRRLGREALERMAQPMVGGIYTADPRYLSMQATMPQFLEMERQHGSIIRALWHAQHTAAQPGKTSHGTSGPRYGLFVSFRHGMQTLIDRLAEALPAGTIRRHSLVREIAYNAERQRWTIDLDRQGVWEAEALCLALAAPQAGQLLRATDAELATALQDIPYASSAIVNVVCDRDQVAHPLNGMGFVVPAIEQRQLIACSFSSVKFAGRAPQGQVLLRAFVGGALHQEQYERSDEAIQDAVLQELRQLLGIHGTPRYMGVGRHPHAMAQYHVGHGDRVARIDQLAGRWPGLTLAGNAYHGVGIPDCIHDADRAATAMLGYLQTTHCPA